MKKFLSILYFLILSPLFIFVTPQFSISYADPYDCQHFGTHQCISLTVTAKCVSGVPQVTLSWNNPHNDSSFNIVYDHDGHWYMKPIFSRTTSTTIAPYGSYQDGGSASAHDPGFKATGGYFAAKITGGAPGSVGGSGITTGYSTPDSTTNMPNCTTPAPTNTPVPTHTPTPPPGPTATPTPIPHTKINLALQLAGIGNRGNLSPKHPTRTVHIQIYKKGDDPSQPNISPVKDITNATVTFNSGNGYFLNAALDLGTLATGDYQILVKTTGFLRKEVVDNQENNVFTLTSGATTTLPSVILIEGDVAPLYNIMDTGDFYAIVDCYGAKATGSTCAAGSQITDLNDDGHIDGVDLNLWLLGMQTLLSNNNSAGTGDGVPGN